MLSFHVKSEQTDRMTNGWTDRWTMVKQYAPELSMLGHEKKPFENIVGKGENAGNLHFLLFPQCFLLIPKTILFV